MTSLQTSSLAERVATEAPDDDVDLNGFWGVVSNFLLFRDNLERSLALALFWPVRDIPACSEEGVPLSEQNADVRHWTAPSTWKYSTSDCRTVYFRVCRLEFNIHLVLGCF